MVAAEEAGRGRREGNESGCCRNERGICLPQEVLADAYTRGHQEFLRVASFRCGRFNVPLLLRGGAGP